MRTHWKIKMFYSLVQKVTVCTIKGMATLSDRQVLTRTAIAPSCVRVPELVYVAGAFQSLLMQYRLAALVILLSK